MGLKRRANFAVVTVPLGYAAGAVTVVVTAGQGALLPASGTDGFWLTWWNATDYSAPEDDPNVERVLCTTRATDTLTITRGQDGTAASAKNISGKTYKMMVSWGKAEIDQVEQVLQTGSFTYAADTGSGTAYAVALDPVPTAYTTGMPVRFKAANTSTGAATLNVNALGAKSLVTKNGQVVGAGDIKAGDVIMAQYDGTNFQILNAVVQPNDVQSGGYLYAADSGAANAAVVTLSPALTAYAAGVAIRVKMAAENTTAATINVNSLGAKSIVDSEGAALVGGELKSGSIYSMVYDGGSFQVQGIIAQSEVWVYTGNGHGATNTKIRRFTTTGRNVGASITYADSGTLGGSFTINKSGLYAIDYKDQVDGTTEYGISVNSVQLTTNVSSITQSTRKMYCALGTTAFLNTLVTLWLSAGDVVRAHTAGNQTAAVDYQTEVRIVRVR